jgi:hypothetical protein
MNLQKPKISFVSLTLTISLILFILFNTEAGRRELSLVNAETDMVNNSTQPTKCHNSNFFLNKTNTIIANVLPPKIFMIYDGKQYDTGYLFSSKYRAGSSFSQLQIPPERIISNIPNNSLTVINGSCLGFVIQNDSLTKTPSSLSVNAYSAQGYALKVLSSVEHSKSNFFNVSLDEGKYILLVVATWLPADQKVTGYTDYNFLIDIRNSK